MSTPHIKELLVKYQLGDSQAFEEFFDLTHKFVFNLIARRINNKDDVNDLFQNVFLRIHQYIGSYNQEYNPITWVASICRNVVYDFLRSKKHMTTEVYEELNHSALPSAAHEEALFQELLNYYFPNLPTEEKALVVRHYINGEDYEEIARNSHSSAENLRKKISRILLRARKFGFSGR